MAGDAANNGRASAARQAAVGGRGLFTAAVSVCCGKMVLRKQEYLGSVLPDVYIPGGCNRVTPQLTANLPANADLNPERHDCLVRSRSIGGERDLPVRKREECGINRVPKTCVAPSQSLWFCKEETDLQPVWALCWI